MLSAEIEKSILLVLAEENKWLYFYKIIEELELRLKCSIVKNSMIISKIRDYIDRGLIISRYETEEEYADRGTLSGVKALLYKITPEGLNELFKFGDL